VFPLKFGSTVVEHSALIPERSRVQTRQLVPKGRTKCFKLKQNSKHVKRIISLVVPALGDTIVLNGKWSGLVRKVAHLNEKQMFLLKNMLMDKPGNPH
jgi:hypothetical protein